MSDFDQCDNSDMDFDQKRSSAAGNGFSTSESPNYEVMDCGYVAYDSTYDPCDAAELQIENLADARIKQVVGCTFRAEDDGTLSAAEKELLGHDDLLLQTVADFHKDGSYDPNTLQKAKIIFDGVTVPACSKGEHRSLSWTPVSNGQSDSTEHTVCPGVSPTQQELLAKSRRGTSGGFLSRFWFFGSGSDVVVYRSALSSCGVRDGLVPVVSLHGRVEVYPKSICSLRVKLPSLYKHTRSRDKTLDATGRVDSSTSRSTQSGFGSTGSSSGTKSTRKKSDGDDFSTESSSTTSGFKTISTNTIQAGGTKGFEDASGTSTSTRNRGLIGSTTDSTAADGAKSRMLSEDQSISLIINDQEVDFVRTIALVVNVATKIQNAWKNFEGAIPKVGWQASFEVEVLSGTIQIDWGTKNSLTHRHARIWEVEEYISFTLKCRLLFVKLEAGLGIDFKVANWLSSHPLIEVILKVTLGFEVDVNLNETYTLSRSEQSRAIKFDSKFEPFFKAQARASAIGYACEASIKATTGIKFEGNLKIGFGCAPRCDGELKWLPCKLTATLEHPGMDSPWVKDVWQWPKKDPKSIWEGNLFGDA